MKRLLELPPDTRLMARAHELVKVLGPTVESEERLVRVRRAMDAPPRANAPRWPLRFALAAGLLGASAAAAAGGGLVASFTQESAPVVVSSAPAAPQPPPRRLSSPRPPSENVELGPASDKPAAVAPTRSVTPRPAAVPSSDVARVHEAATALRQGGDPGRALRLLEEKPVTGPLAEEALVLRIEASKARKDGQAAKLAAQYLARYPSGRYRDVAKATLTAP